MLDTVLAATKSLGWSPVEQERRIVLAVRSDEAGPAASRFKTLDYLLDDKEMEPVKVNDHKVRVAYLGYSSGTSGKAKGVRTSVYNMTASRFPQAICAGFWLTRMRAQSVLSILAPLKTYEDDVQLAVLPLNRKFAFSLPMS